MLKAALIALLILIPIRPAVPEPWKDRIIRLEQKAAIKCAEIIDRYGLFSRPSPTPLTPTIFTGIVDFHEFMKSMNQNLIAQTKDLSFEDTLKTLGFFPTTNWEEFRPWSEFRGWPTGNKYIVFERISDPLAVYVHGDLDYYGSKLLGLYSTHRRVFPSGDKMFGHLVRVKMGRDEVMKETLRHELNHYWHAHFTPWAKLDADRSRQVYQTSNRWKKFRYRVENLNPRLLGAAFLDETMAWAYEKASNPVIPAWESIMQHLASKKEKPDWNFIHTKLTEIAEFLSHGYPYNKPRVIDEAVIWLREMHETAMSQR